MDRAIASLSTPTVSPLQECVTYSSCMDCLVTNVCIFLILTTGKKKCVDEESANNNYTGRIRDRLDFIDTCTIDEPYLTDFTLAKFVHDYMLTKSHYTRSEPPSIKSNGTTTASLGITVHSFSMTDYDSLFEVDCNLLMEWEDSRLTFRQKENPAHHMTISYTDSEIWVPPVKVINPNDPKNGTEIITRYDTTHLVRMDSHGKGNWSRFPAILISKCDLDLYRFPFDGQTCNITLSMGEETSKHDLDLQFSSKMKNNSEHGISFHADLEYSNWRMYDWGVNRMEVVHSCCPAPFIELVFSFDIQRKSNSLAAIWAMVVLCFLTLLNLIVGFFTPTNKGGLQLNFTVKHIVLALIIFVLNVVALISYAIYTRENVGSTPILVSFLIMNSIIAAFYLAIILFSKWEVNKGAHVHESFRKLDSDKFARWCFSCCGPYDPLPHEAEQEERRPFVEMTGRKPGNGNGNRSPEAGPSFITLSAATAGIADEAQKRVNGSRNGKGKGDNGASGTGGKDDPVPVAVDETVFGEGEVTTTTGESGDKAIGGVDDSVFGKAEIPTTTGTGGSGDTATGGVDETVFGKGEIPATGVKDETAKDKSGAAANVGSGGNETLAFSNIPLNGSNGGNGGNGHGGNGRDAVGGNGHRGNGGNGRGGIGGNGHGGNGGNGHGASGASALNVVADPNRPRGDADETCTREWTTLALFLHRLFAIANVIGAIILIAKWG